MRYLKHFEDYDMLLPTGDIPSKFTNKFTNFKVGDEVILVGNGTPNEFSTVGIGSQSPIAGQKYTIKQIVPINKSGNVCDDSSPYFSEYHIYLHELSIFHYFLPDQLTTDPNHPRLKKIHQQRFDL